VLTNYHYALRCRVLLPGQLYLQLFDVLQQIINFLLFRLQAGGDITNSTLLLLLFLRPFERIFPQPLQFVRTLCYLLCLLLKIFVELDKHSLRFVQTICGLLKLCSTIGELGL